MSTFDLFTQVALSQLSVACVAELQQCLDKTHVVLEIYLITIVLLSVATSTVLRFSLDQSPVPSLFVNWLQMCANLARRFDWVYR